MNSIRQPRNQVLTVDGGTIETEVQQRRPFALGKVNLGNLAALGRRTGRRYSEVTQLATRGQPTREHDKLYIAFDKAIHWSG